VVDFLDVLVIALWVLVGFPLLAWGFWVLHKNNRALKDLEAMIDRRREGTTP